MMIQHDNELEQTADFYNQKKEILKKSEYGSSSFSPYLRAPYEFAENIIAQNRHPSSLDFCCGNGVHSYTIASQSDTYIGIDISGAQITKAKERLKGSGLRNWEFVLGDALDFLMTRESTFDLIFCSGSLYYLDHKRVLNLIFRRLAAGGIFVNIETNGSNLMLNAYRRIRYFWSTKRDKQTKSNLLRIKDFNSYSDIFPNTEVKYFDFLTLALSLLPKKISSSNRLLVCVQRIDNFLLNRLGLKHLAFKAVVICRKV